MSNNTSAGIKKSQFNALTTVPGTATLDFVDNGTNKKILFSDFIAALGVTGTIEAVGDVTGTQILDVQGSVNGIRNLVEGVGITLTITAQNGIEIKTSFTFDETGEALVAVPSSQAPDFKSLLQSTHMLLTSTSSTISFAVDPSQLVPANQVVINSPTDFPAAAGGVRTLAANTEYFIGNNVNIGSDRFALSAGTLFSGLGAAAVLTTTTTGAVFSGDGVGFVLFNRLAISAPNADIFNIVDTVQGTTIISIRDTVVFDCNTVGTIGNLGGFGVNNSNFQCTNDGISFAAGLMGVITLGQVFFQTTSATAKFIDLGTATSSTIEFRDLLFVGVSGTIAISGLASNGNVVSGSVAEVQSCEFIGGITPLENIVESDFRWKFTSSPPITDTKPVAFGTMNGNAEQTVISTQGVPVKVNTDNTFVSEVSTHYTIDNTGTITYIAESKLCVSVDILLTAQLPSGTNNCSVLLALNGTVIPNSVQQQELTAGGTPRNMSTIWVLEIVENDTLEIFVQNDDATTNIIAVVAKFRIT